MNTPKYNYSIVFLSLSPTYLCSVSEQNIYTIIVAGGSGKRMGTETPKQFILLNGLPVLAHTLRVFHSYNSKMPIFLVLTEDVHAQWKKLCEEFTIEVPHTLVPGGKERFDSVKNGLNAIQAEEGIVAIHDGVRPLVSKETIDRCIGSASLTGGSLPVLALTDSLRNVFGNFSIAVDRSNFVSVQTPQCFSLKAIRQAYNLPYQASFTDDASVFEAAGGKLQLVEGNRENMKITMPGDIELASFLLRG